MMSYKNPSIYNKYIFIRVILIISFLFSYPSDGNESFASTRERNYSCDNTNVEAKAEIKSNLDKNTVSLSLNEVSICSGDALVWTVTAIGYKPEELIYKWYYGGDIIEGETSSTLSFELNTSKNERRYGVKVFNSSGDSTYVEKKVSVGPEILQKWDNVLFISNIDTLYVSYQWYKNDKVIEGATAQFYREEEKINTSDEYYVEVELEDGSKIISCSKSIKAIAVKELSSKIKIYPNPLEKEKEKYLFIDLGTERLYDSKDVEIFIYDPQGKLIAQENIAREDTEYDTSQLELGIYVIYMRINTSMFFVDKLIVK